MTNLTPSPELTRKEQQAIERFKKVAEALPSSLWVWCADNRLYIMKKDHSGQRVMTPLGGRLGGGPDPNYVVETIEVESDGGDW